MFDEINLMLAGLCDDCCVEPIDDPNCHPMDWAEVTGLVDELVDEIYPEPVEMIDEDGFTWIVG